jgi:polyhydroxybutyrate depolymerase
MPLLIVLHGGGGTGRGMEKVLTLGGLNTLADTERFIAVYPDGIGKHWNDGRDLRRYRAHRERVDDVGFITALIDYLAGTLPIDRQRVYVTGMSNGGHMAFRLACEKTEKIAAIAVVTASLTENLGPRCSPSVPLSVLIMNGTEDPLVPWHGGAIQFRRRTFGMVWSTPDTVRYWVNHNTCVPTPDSVDKWDENSQDGTWVKREVYGRCEEGVEVVLFSIQGGGHTWPSGYQYLPERLIGKTSMEISAEKAIWDFFKNKKRDL